MFCVCFLNASCYVLGCKGVSRGWYNMSWFGRDWNGSGGRDGGGGGGMRRVDMVAVLLGRDCRFGQGHMCGCGFGFWCRCRSGSRCVQWGGCSFGWPGQVWVVGCIPGRSALDIVRELVGVGFMNEGCGCVEEGEGIDLR